MRPRVAGPIGNLTLPPQKRKITISGPGPNVYSLLYLIFYAPGILSNFIYQKRNIHLFFLVLKLAIFQWEARGVGGL